MNSTSQSYPLVILGGCGNKPPDYNPGCCGDEYKPLREILGRTIIERNLSTLSHLRNEDGIPVYNPILIAGPEERYQKYLGNNDGLCTLLINTDGPLHTNLDVAFSALNETYSGRIVVMAAGDLHFKTDDLRDYAAWIDSYNDRADGFLFFTPADLVRAETGIKKPQYRVHDRGGVPVVCNWGQVYAFRSGKLKEDIIVKGAEVGYDIRAKGFKRMLLSAIIRGREALYQDRAPFEKHHALANALLTSLQLKFNAFSLNHADERLADLLFSPSSRVVVEIMPWGSLAGDHDEDVDFSGLESRLKHA